MVPVAALAVWGLVAATSLRMEGSVIAGRSLIANGHAVATGATKMANPVTKEQNGFGTSSAATTSTPASGTTPSRSTSRRSRASATPLSAMSGVGVGGYTIGDRVYVLDRLGLGDALTARLEVDRPGFIGHEKVLPDAWLAARVTDDDVPPGSFGKGVFGTELYVSPPGRADADADVARRVLRCSVARPGSSTPSATRDASVGRCATSASPSVSPG